MHSGSPGPTVCEIYNIPQILFNVHISVKYKQSITISWTMSFNQMVSLHATGGHHTSSNFISKLLRLNSSPQAWSPNSASGCISRASPGAIWTITLGHWTCVKWSILDWSAPQGLYLPQNNCNLTIFSVLGTDKHPKRKWDVLSLMARQCKWKGHANSASEAQTCHRCFVSLIHSYPLQTLSNKEI